MINIPSDIEAAFLAAGWMPDRLNNCYSDNTTVSNVYAHAVFQTFGGLNVGVCSSGLEVASSNIYFLPIPVPAKSIVVSKWQNKLGVLTAVADAHHDHMIIYVSEKGEYYCFTDPDEKLYRAGVNFGEAVRNLLLGYRLGLEIEPDNTSNIS